MIALVSPPRSQLLGLKANSAVTGQQNAVQIANSIESY